MATRVGINGFGRIGRQVFRQMMQTNGVEVVAVNDIAPVDNLVYLLTHDSVYGPPAGEIEATDHTLRWNGREVRFISQRNPADLPWEKLEVDIAIEATRRFTSRSEASAHLAARVRRVIVTAPTKDADITICMGVNEEAYQPANHYIISNASCTTNCLAVVAKTLDDAFGIETGFLTTVHAYTSSQSLVDAPSKRWRRGRAAALSIVPTSTGAAVATTLVLPHLKGKLDGLAMRVPTPAGSIIDFVAQTSKPVSVEEVNAIFHAAAKTKRLRGILAVSEDELVSVDIVGGPESAIVDAPVTMALGDRSIKVLAWYDNERGYSQRVVDLTRYVGERTARFTSAVRSDK